MTDQQIRDFFSRVQTGVVTDAMNLLGLEGWMEDIFPFRPEERIFGRAFTVQAAPPRCPDEPNYTIYDLSELWKPGDVLVIDGMDKKCSLLGENMAHVCMYGGLAGVVLNGRCRDYGEIRDLEMPVFGKGPAMRLKGGILKFVAYNTPLEMAGAQIKPGDYILGDVDGVLVFPQDQAEAIIYQAEMILEVEAAMEEAISRRASVAEIKSIMARKKQKRA